MSHATATLSTSAVTRIRPATAADVPRIVEMALRFIASSPYQRFLPANADALALLAPAVMESGVVLLAVLERVYRADGAELAREQHVIGMLAIVALTHPLSGETYGDELAWYVEPEYRRGTVGPRLLAAGEAWGRAHGLGLLKMVAPAGSDVGLFYERRGYVEVETVFQKTLSGDSTAPKAVP
jgi:GNAT superfamily N-acetyltransferase